VKPFRHWVVDNWTAPGGPLPEDVAWEVTYDNDCERGKKTTRHLGTLPRDYQFVFARMESSPFVSYMTDETGIAGLQRDRSMHGAGLHVSLPGSWLQVHLDFERVPDRPHLERRLSVIVFLHAEWRPEWGGQLLLCDPMGKTVTAIDPLPGRLVAFESGVSSYHGVRRTSPDAPPRVSAAAYYLAPARESATRLRALFLPNRDAPECPREVR
jgi:Rps23 Pro-64 3,4-dihydroxylase Tpa1-like proline 4-hydroxylase